MTNKISPNYIRLDEADNVIMATRSLETGTLVEDMLTTAPTEKYGTVTLREHYERIAVEGQEYDPYTTMLAPKNK